MLGRPPLARYQRNRGPGFADLATALRRHSIQAAADLSRLLRMAIVNLWVGNLDAHAKNFSLLYTDDGIRLAPFYDVVATLVYPGLTPAYSMYIGGASEPRDPEPGRDRAVRRGASGDPGNGSSGDRRGN